MNIATISPHPVSVAALVALKPKLFYQQQASDFTHPVFTAERYIDQSIITAYGDAHASNQLDWGRSHNLSEEEIKYPTFPLLETLAWWMAFTIMHDGHNRRSFVTPSSTFIDGYRLGVALLVNDSLRVAYTFVARDTSPPHQQIWPAITW